MARAAVCAGDGEAAEDERDAGVSDGAVLRTRAESGAGVGAGDAGVLDESVYGDAAAGGLLRPIGKEQGTFHSAVVAAVRVQDGRGVGGGFAAVAEGVCSQGGPP